MLQDFAEVGFEPRFSGSLVAHFLYENGFESAQTADAAGFTPLHYASVLGDPALVRDLLRERADIHRRTKQAQPELGLMFWMSALDLRFFKGTMMWRRFC